MNPLFMAMNNKGGKINQTAHILNMLKSGNPAQIAQQMIQNNPQFRQFVEANKGKTPEQVAQENGINLDEIRRLMR